MVMPTGGTSRREGEKPPAVREEHDEHNVKVRGNVELPNDIESPGKHSTDSPCGVLSKRINNRGPIGGSSGIS